MTPFSTDWLLPYQQRINADPEMAVVGRWFTTAFWVTAGSRRTILRFERGTLHSFIEAPRLDDRAEFGFVASEDVWARFLSPRPQPLYHDFFAMLMRVPAFVLEGDSLVAMQHARALHRAMNLMRAPDGGAAAAPRVKAGTQRDGDAPVTFEPITGRYLHVSVEGVMHRVFVEEAGTGTPLLCLHTAGADSRQFRHLLNDAAITSRFRVIAFDLPYHGRSNPPDRWWLSRYQLTTAQYVAYIRAVWQALGLERPVVIGCSMGGAIVLKLAADFAHELRGIIGLESAAYAPGRYNDFLHHPAIHGGELVASYTYGLCAPGSPDDAARENWWYYSQSGPGIYAGDVHFYSVDWDGREDVKRIDGTTCKVSLLTGEYDYSCTPSMTRAVAEMIPNARLTIMDGMGHFPMIENYPVFRKYLLKELESMTGRG
ncbi:MAG TPA: alpha/beta hydrolase [Vicinamibacterales bacterium]|nr:alpha/beta hydrolase [Vicinamibacterales bacterium]